DLDPVAVGLDLEALEVGIELLARDCRGGGDEEVDPERRRSELAKLADLGPDGGRRLVAAGQESEASGAPARGRQLRGRWTPRHRRLNDRVVKLAEDHRLCP